jgi:predicted DNA-binding mobile mystery protein A
MKLPNSQLMILRQIDKKIQVFSNIGKGELPFKGWVKTIRTSLNMSLRQLGERMVMSAQGIRDLEKREAEGTITLNSLREASQALNMKLVYALIPIDGSLEEMIEKRARDIAIKIVKRTSITMALEDQANSNERLKQAIDEMTQDLKREMPKKLWD